MAVNQSVDVYSENKRIVSTIESKEFGTVCFVAIGATMVGSICLTAAPGSTVTKGDEYGYFGTLHAQPLAHLHTPARIYGLLPTILT